MKKTKLLTSLAAFVLVLGLGGCNSNDEGTTSSEDGTTSQTTESESETTPTTDTDDGGNEGGDEGGNEPVVIAENLLFGFETDGTNYYIDGGLVDYNGTPQSYEGSYTTEVADAVRVKVESTATVGEYYLSYVLEDTTYWITIISGDYINLSYSTEAAPLYWNAEYSCWGENTLSYFLCQNSTYECLYCSAISEYGPNGSKGASPIAGLYTEDGEAYTTGLVGYELPAPTSITVTGSNSLYASLTTQLSATVEPANAVADVTWSSSNEAYATVDETGVVTGIGEGTATITATSVEDTSISGSIDITIKETTGKILTYYYSFVSGNGITKDGGTVTLGGLQWTTTSAEYIGGEYSGNSRGLQIGTSNYPQTTPWTISTDFGENVTLISVGINVVGASSSTGANFTITHGNTKVADAVSFSTTAKDYEYNDLEVTGSSLSISMVCTDKAMYLKYISFIIIAGSDSSLNW